jgi:hypothetical protein
VGDKDDRRDFQCLDARKAITGGAGTSISLFAKLIVTDIGGLSAMIDIASKNGEFHRVDSDEFLTDLCAASVNDEIIVSSKSEGQSLSM